MKYWKFAGKILFSLPVLALTQLGCSAGDPSLGADSTDLGGDDSASVGQVQQADSVCQSFFDPDCRAQPDPDCGYTTGSCPAGMHSVARNCWSNCGDWDFSNSNHCAADGGANALDCRSDTDDFLTCDNFCPTGFTPDRGSIAVDAACGSNVTHVRCQKTVIHPVGGDFLLQHSGGLCVHPKGGATVPAPDTQLILYPYCANEPRLKYRMLSNGSIQHVSSGECLNPLGGSLNPTVGTPLVLHPDCGNPAQDPFSLNRKLRFEVTAGGSIRHVNSGLCIHPQGGQANPAANTPLLLWSGCDEPRLRFDKR